MSRQTFRGYLLIVYAVLIVGLCESCKPTAHQVTCGTKSKVTFNIQTPKDDSIVFLTGNVAELKSWNPRGIPIKLTNGQGQKSICLPADTAIAFKLTAGSWSSEAIYSTGKTPANSEFNLRGDTVITRNVIQWKDDLEQSTVGMTGTFDRYESMSYPGLQDRNITVWLPPNYATQPAARYPVLYMHDGQNVFNPNTSTLGVDWGADEWADSLIRNQVIEPIIVVAINNADDRFLEYSPGEKGELYMSFIVNKLKPFVDSVYRTKSDRSHTAVMGASMGGLISFMLHWKYNAVFGKAACLSPAFVFQTVDYTHDVKTYKGKQKSLLVFISNGTEGLDADLQHGCDEMMKALDDAGYEYTWWLDKEAPHNETAWNRLMPKLLTWLFPAAGVN